jgi:hypothetical protein
MKHEGKKTDREFGVLFHLNFAAHSTKIQDCAYHVNDYAVFVSKCMLEKKLSAKEEKL